MSCGVKLIGSTYMSCGVKLIGNTYLHVKLIGSACLIDTFRCKIGLAASELAASELAEGIPYPVIMTSLIIPLQGKD